MDPDLERLTREELIAEIRALREAIRGHRDASLHDLCWYQPKLWGLLPDKSAAQIEVPTRDQFIKGCEIFAASLDRQLPDAPRIDVQFED